MNEQQQMDFDLECINLLIECLDEEISKKGVKRKLFELEEIVEGNNFSFYYSYAEGVLKAFELSDDPFLTTHNIEQIGLENRFWDHKTQFGKNNRYRVLDSVTQACKRYYKNGKLDKTCVNGTDYYSLLI